MVGLMGCRLAPLGLLVQARHAAEFFREDHSALPPKLVCAQFSRSFLEQYFERAIENDDIVDDLILGTKINGASHISAGIQLELVPSYKDIRFDLVLSGFNRSQTQGVHSVVVLQNAAETQFQARKQFVWNSKGFSYFPTVAVPDTRSRTGRIDSTLPGSLGRIATQIAERRVAELRSQADAIASQHAVARIETALDARVDHAFAWARSVSRRLPTATFIRRETRIKLSSARDAVQIVVFRRDAA